MISAKIQYRQVVEDVSSMTWFPELFEFKVWRWSSGQSIDSPISIAREEGWTTRDTYRLTELKVNSELPPDVFDLQPPDGTYVIDELDGKSFVVGQPLPTPRITTEPNGNSWLIWFLTCAVVILLVLVIKKRVKNL